MKLAILRHIHKRGTDVYTSLVGDNATDNDRDKVVAAMIREHKIDYDQPESGVEIHECEILDLKLQDFTSIKALSVGWDTAASGISDGVWRYSEEFDEVTTSRRGIIEGSKRVCLVGNTLKDNSENRANGRAIAAVPFMLKALRDVRLYLGKTGEVGRDQAINSVKIALGHANF